MTNPDRLVHASEQLAGLILKEQAAIRAQGFQGTPWVLTQALAELSKVQERLVQASEQYKDDLQLNGMVGIDLPQANLVYFAAPSRN